MKKLLITAFAAQLVLWCSYSTATGVEDNTKSISFDQVLAPKHKKVKFKINTIAGKNNVHLEFEANKLSAGQYAVYKTNNCDLKNFSPGELKKLGSKNLFFSFTTTSGNIFEERKIDFNEASKFNIGIYSFVLVKMGSQKTAVVCFTQ